MSLFLYTALLVRMDRLVSIDSSVLKTNHTPYVNSLPPNVLAKHVSEAQSAKSLDALLRVATECAEHYVTPKFWEVGMIGQSPREVASLAALASRRPYGLICEIGFNAGHSALLWLRQAPRAHLHIFDLLGLPHSRASKAFVEAAYPGRVDFWVGDSTVTVADYASQVENGTARPCDLWFIDGAHTGETPRHDFKNALRAAAGSGAFVAADDVTTGWFAVKRVWDALVQAGRIRHESCDEEILCAKGERAPSIKGRRGRWLQDTGPLLPCHARGTPPCHPRNDLTTRCFKKRWCEAEIMPAKSMLS